MTRHPIAQFARNGNPNRKKSGPAPAISCEIDYFARRVWPGTSTVPRFFTDDQIADIVAVGFPFSGATCIAEDAFRAPAIPCSAGAQQRHKIIHNGVALAGEESVSGATGGSGPRDQSGEPTHA